ncbi:DNA repair endonuclease rad2 [Fusarium heterosporum]|uniref:DNA repair endonuclease rad2 n=1 Tax=Fusarium heterosporum TaxID=42747 RepID=A0A8H5TAK3_FUSHE|nr:DNA repair endonuclease rad2 [Fusarium heterosporum]
MGIKGIYQEIGEGERVSLLKLAAESLEKQGRPLRIAIDIAIWQFQNQAAQGGTNPEIRTLFYRLVRLLACPVEPIFVFDGPYKPEVKRNKKSGRGSSFANAQAKRLIRLFGCNIHDAPGEAEAECALLQRHGIVDVVLTEDVDALMFGCTKMLRRWSPQSKRSTTPTHVSVFDTDKMELGQQGLDREGMVLVALMSGGDYDPDGIPGCGIKVAVEAAKAGFGKDICRRKAVDKEGIQAWRNSLIHELRTNEKGYFKRRNKALTIPEDFPDLKILRYYTHPVVSPESSLDDIREKVHLRREILQEDLREFTREVFGWDFRIGALKFLKVISQAVLVQKLQVEGTDNREDLVKGIKGTRNDAANDLVPQIRLQHVPIEVVPIDLSKEEDENILQGRSGLALNSDDEVEDQESMEAPSSSKRSSVPFDPSAPLGVWTLAAFARICVPSLIDSMATAKNQNKGVRQPKQTKPKKSKSGLETGMSAGALNKFVRTTKLSAASKVPKDISKDALQEGDRATSPTRTNTSRRLRMPSPLEPSKQPTSVLASPVRQTANPWTLVSSQVTPRTSTPADKQQQAIVITSSPLCAADSPPPSPSPQPRTRVPVSQKLSNTMHTNPIFSASSQRLKDPVRSFGHARPPATSQSSEPPKLKQTSIDMFARKFKAPSSSQASLTKPPPPPLKQQQKPQPEFDDDFDSDSSSDLAPLSSLISGLPASPSKRLQRSAPPDRSDSPGSAPMRKKKLLIPMASATGFFKEVEVEAEKRDELVARETAALERKGVQAKIVRVSDIGFIDLTQDD